MASRFSIQNFEELPNFYKISVWNYIDKLELQTLRTVSRLWKHQIETYFGISILITQESWPYWLRMKPNHAVTEVVFQSFTSRFSPSVFTNNIQSITFRNIVLKNNLICILQHFPNIDYLCFSRIALDQESEIFTPYPIVLPKLKTLQIHATLTEDGELSIFDDLILRFMAQAKYGALENFCFWCPSHLLPDFHLQVLFNGSMGDTDWLVEIIDHNRETIKSVQFGSPYRPYVLEFRERQMQPGTSDLSPMQLKDIEGIDLFPKTWDMAIRTQHFLRSIQLHENAFSHWDAAYNAIKQSLNTIEVVVMSGGGGKYTIVNLDCFNNCTKLRGLLLHFEVYRFDNIKSLPALLRVLSLHGPLTKFQIKDLSQNFPSLQIFSLDNKETSDDADWITTDPTSDQQLFLGATIDVAVFRQLVLMPKLESLTLSNITMICNGIKKWYETQSYFECKMQAMMKPLNQAGTLGSIQARIDVGSKRRVLRLVEV